METVTEELEALRAVFMDDITIDRDSNVGQTVVHYSISGSLVMDITLPGCYPNDLPIISLPDHLIGLGLKKQLDDIAIAHCGFPVLYLLLDAAKTWIEGHPLNFQSSQFQKDPANSQSRDGDTLETENQPKRKPLHKQDDRKFGRKFPDGNVGSPKSPKGKNKSDSSDNNSRLVKTQVKGKKHHEEQDQGAKKQRMRPASEVISRIHWDPELPTSSFVVGYLDRFTGIIEKPFSAFFWDDISTVGSDVLAIPKHRIQYFKYNKEIVWDKRCQLDNFFGSRGSKTIHDIVSLQKNDKQETTKAAEVFSENDNSSTPSHIDEDILLGAEASLEEANTSGYSNKDRPTHFVCFHVTNEEVKSEVSKIQQEITKFTPQLIDGCHPLTALHVTVCMVRLANDQEIEVAKQVMESCRLQFISLLPRCVHLIFNGVNNFRDRLVYVTVKDEPALTKFSSHLLEQFRMKGLRTPGNHDKYTPHMTIVKLTRPLCHELHTNYINPSTYQAFTNTPVGKQEIGALSLCSMSAPKQSDGFYLRLATVSNSLLGLSSSIVLLIEKQILSLAKLGILVNQEKELYLHKLNEAAKNSDINEFEEVIRELRYVQQPDHRSLPQATVVIMRGLPGSGKSHIARNCMEMLTNNISIISADDFFLRSGTYNYVPSLTFKAHEECIHKLLDALLLGKELIVIDNTNSRHWEYQIFLYLSELLSYRCFVLEIPCPTVSVANKFGKRNAHSVSPQAVLNMFQRWEKDERALYIPPNLVHFNQPVKQLSYSLLSLCENNINPFSSDMNSIEELSAVYTGVFLTTESQWKLLDAYPPNYSQQHATHVTLVFQPTRLQLSSTKIGKKVTLQVVGSADNGQIQAVAVDLPFGISSQNPVAHITISTKDDVSPKLAGPLLQKQLSRSSQPLVLEGVVGVVLRKTTEEELMELQPSSDSIAAAKQCTIISTKQLKELAPKLFFQQSKDDSDVIDNYLAANIVTGYIPVTKLFVFDFDGTLFNTPDRLEGKKQYEELTNTKYPHKGWLSEPASLLPPVKVPPGPAFSEFRSHSTIAGSLTVLLSGRLEKTRIGVTTVLTNSQLYPQRIVLKPNNMDKSTRQFKQETVQQLLKEFPQINLVKFWDDLAENLEAIRCLSKERSDDIQFEVIDATKIQPKCIPQPSSLVPRPTESVLATFLSNRGLLPTMNYRAAANEGVLFIASQFAKVIGFKGQPNFLVYQFGSNVFGRLSDVDLCLLAPFSSSPLDWIKRLSTQLESCGITYTHIGYSSRCPRLKVMLLFENASAIEFDIVVAVLDQSKFSESQEKKLTLSYVTSHIRADDSQSKIAIGGPVFSEGIIQILNHEVSTEQFAAVIEMTVQFLVSKREKGNAYACIRTFHLVKLLLNFVQSHPFEGIACNSDTLFKLFFQHLSQLSYEKWAELMETSVPEEYISRLMNLFQSAMQTLVAKHCHPSALCYSELLERSEFPPENHTMVEIKLSGVDELLVWKTRSFIEALLPSYIYKLLAKGLQVASDGNTYDCNRFCFSVLSMKSARQTLQSVLRPFWNELESYRNKSGIKIQLTFGKPSDGFTASNDQASSERQKTIIDTVNAFATSSEKELHLPTSLSGHDRLQVHEVAEKLNLQHNTVTSNKTKHIVLKKND